MTRQASSAISLYGHCTDIVFYLHWNRCHSLYFTSLSNYPLQSLNTVQHHRSAPLPADCTTDHRECTMHTACCPLLFLPCLFLSRADAPSASPAPAEAAAVAELNDAETAVIRAGVTLAPVCDAGERELSGPTAVSHSFRVITPSWQQLALSTQHPINSTR